MVFCWHHFSCILLFRIFFFETSFCGFPWGLLSWHLLWHLFLLASLFSWLSRCYFVLQKLAQRLPSTTVHYKSLHKHFPELLCTTRLAQSTCQNYFALQSSHKALPNTTSYYKTCRKYFQALLSTTMLAQLFPVLLCTTRLAENSSPVQLLATKLAQALSSTTSKYYFPCPLCTPQLAQSIYINISQYYFALQDLHKILPSSPCLSRFLAHRSFLHTETVAHRSFYRQKLLTHRNFQTEKSLHAFFTQRRFYTEKSLHTETFIYTWKLSTHRSL